MVDLPAGKTAVDSKVIFVLKRHPNGEILKYKARLVARGFSQRPGEDYDETFASVTKPPSVRLLLALVAQEGWEAHVCDVNNAFLNAPLTEEIYLQQPKGMDDGSGKVYRLLKALYGLKQAPRLWNEQLGKHLESHGFQRSDADDALYLLLGPRKGDVCFVPVWVDDLLLVSNSERGVAHAKQVLREGFSIKDLGPVATYLGMQVSRDRNRGTLDITLEAYISGLSSRFAPLLQEETGRCQTPMSPEVLSKMRKGPLGKDEAAPVERTEDQGALGCLSFCANTARPDLTFTVSVLGQAAADPRMIHMRAMGRALKYLIKTKGMGLRYSRGQGQGASLVVGYTDSDWAGEPNGESRAAYVFMAAGAALSWYSKKLGSIGASTAEAEYKALSQGTKEAIWFRRLLESLHMPSSPIPI